VGTEGAKHQEGAAQQCSAAAENHKDMGGKSEFVQKQKTCQSQFENTV